jgi:type VI secretion system protein ImpE
MSAVEEIRAGNIDQALQMLRLEVRAHPAEPKHRVFLFQLLAIQGEWDKALTQLNLAGELDVANLQMMHAYREALQCEVFRESVFAGKHAPVIFGQPQDWLAQMLNACSMEAEGNYAQAQSIRRAALQAAPASSGTINGEAFEWLADADSRLGPMLEILINGRYYWTPFYHIKSIHLEAPADLRDSVWMPAHFTWTNEGTAVGFIPTRYAGSTLESDSAIRLARKTAWREPYEGTVFGIGQRTLTTDLGDYPLMDVRSIVFNSVPDAASSEHTA